MSEPMQPEAKKLTKHDVAGSVIIYNSEARVVQNIASYIEQIDHLFVVDNSEIPNQELVTIIRGLQNTTYISSEGNKGIAYALNLAANAALQKGYHFLLTMDDDSCVPKGMVDSMLAFIIDQGVNQIGIVGAQSMPERVNESVSAVLFTITSGNLLNLDAYAACGPFMESLFIDWVDHEYCFRLIKAGFRVFELNSLALKHRLGQAKQARILGITIRSWPSHSGLRMYYKVRNSLYVLQEYKYILPWSIKRMFYRAMLTDLINILFFEDHKLYRLKLVIRAWIDYRKGNLGKFNGDRDR